MALANDLNGKKARTTADQPKWIFQDIKSGEPWAIPVANELARFNPLDLLKALQAVHPPTGLGEAGIDINENSPQQADALMRSRFEV